MGEHHRARAPATGRDAGERLLVTFRVDSTGYVTFMIQFSEIKPVERGFGDQLRANVPALLYDYARRPYGVQWVQDEAVAAGETATS
jgi:hypothetical protein